MPSRREIAEQDEGLIRRWRELRVAAVYVAEALAQLPAVEQVVLFGSVAQPLQREVPRFRAYRRAGIKLFHECKDVDLAVWTGSVSDLRSWQRARVEGLSRLAKERRITFAHHQIEVFIMDARTGEHLGRLCNFRHCPAEKSECRASGCGREPLLRQVEGFDWQPNALAVDRHVVLYDPHADPPMVPAAALKAL